MYKILLLSPAQKDLDEFRGKTFDILVGKITSLKENPRPHGCLKLTAERGYRMRSGNYRIIYRIDDKKKKSSFTGLNTEKIIEAADSIIFSAAHCLNSISVSLI